MQSKEEKQREADNIKVELVPGKGFVNVNDPRFSQTETQTTPENMQPKIVNLENVVDAEAKIKALQQSPVFKDLGDALSNIPPPEAKPQLEKKKSVSESLGAVLAMVGGNGNSNDPEPLPPKEVDPLVCRYCGAKLKPSWTWCNNCGAPVKPQTQQSFMQKIKPHHIGWLDLFAGAVTFIIWVAATAWMLQSFGWSWGLLIGLAVFWLGFVVVFRLMIGGLLD